MIKQKSIEGAVPTDDRDAVEIRIITDQKEVREVIGDQLMTKLLDDAHFAFHGRTSHPGRAYVFLVFTDEGKGKFWLADSTEQDATNDDDEVIIIKLKMDKHLGHERAHDLWLKAKKLKGWTD